MSSPVPIAKELETFGDLIIKSRQEIEDEKKAHPKISTEDRRAISALERVLSIVASSMRMSYSLMCAYVDGHKWYMKETRSEVYESLQKLLDVAFEQ